LGFEIVLFMWGGLFLVAFLASFITDWLRTTNNLGAIIFAALPLSFALLHRRIRIERAKGPDALYRKMLATKR